MNAPADGPKEERLKKTELIRCPKDLSIKLAIISTWRKKPIAELIDPFLRSAVDSLFTIVRVEMERLEAAS